MEPGGPEVLSEVSIHALLVECDRGRQSALFRVCGFNPRTPCGVRLIFQYGYKFSEWFQSTHSLWSATGHGLQWPEAVLVSIHALLVECDVIVPSFPEGRCSFNPRTPCGVRRSFSGLKCAGISGFNPRTPCGVRPIIKLIISLRKRFQSTHSLWSATAPDLIHCYSTEQIILCANLPKKTVIARLLFLSIYLSIFYSQCITPIADLPGNSCELEVGAQAMFNSL